MCSPPPPTPLLPPKAPSLIMRKEMQVELGLRGVSINTLQIVKRGVRCSAFVCVCVCVFISRVRVHACKKSPLSLSVMEGLETENGL